MFNVNGNNVQVIVHKTLVQYVSVLNENNSVDVTLSLTWPTILLSAQTLVCFTILYNTIQYNTNSLFNIKHLQCYLAYKYKTFNVYNIF